MWIRSEVIKEWAGEVRYSTRHQGRACFVTGGMKDYPRNPQRGDRVGRYIFTIPRFGFIVTKLCPNLKNLLKCKDCLTVSRQKTREIKIGPGKNPGEVTLWLHACGEIRSWPNFSLNKKNTLEPFYCSGQIIHASARGCNFFLQLVERLEDKHCTVHKSHKNVKLSKKINCTKHLWVFKVPNLLIIYLCIRIRDMAKP